MKQYFGICLEFSKEQVFTSICDRVQQSEKGAVYVVDGTVLSYAVRDAGFRKLINRGVVNICDGGSIALLAGSIHGQTFRQYTGSDIFNEFIARGYRQCFLGGTAEKLAVLRSKMLECGVRVDNCLFEPLPFRRVEDFDYKGISERINDFGAELIWVSLGAPKQEQFIDRLLPHLDKGVCFAVGAAFNFYSGLVQRAPEWMRKMHIEFVHRIASEPKKQIKRCWGIVTMYPQIIYKEWRVVR